MKGINPMPEHTYRPSNSDEGDWFEAQFCDCCERQADYPGCYIKRKALMYHAGDVRYPKEWIYDEGKPTCTAFKRVRHAGDPLPGQWQPQGEEMDFAFYDETGVVTEEAWKSLKAKIDGGPTSWGYA